MSEWTEGEIAQLMRMREAGKTFVECSDVLRRSEKSCRLALYRRRQNPEAAPRPASGWPRVPHPDNATRIYLEAMLRGMRKEGLAG